LCQKFEYLLNNPKEKSFLFQLKCKVLFHEPQLKSVQKFIYSFKGQSAYVSIPQIQIRKYMYVFMYMWVL